MSRKPVVAVGDRYGRLLVAQREGSTSRGAALWKCVCDCGVEKIQRSDQLTNGSSVSCGCYAVELLKARSTTHGKTDSFEFRVWTAMRNRCYYDKHPRYARYGGRGITICARWGKFENFLKDMGECPFANGSIERVNNDKGYSLSNCVWLPKNMQSKNRAFNKKH
jgi:hypothetical protein